MEFCCAYGVVVVPEWKSASFWPFIHPTYSSFAHFVADFMFLPMRRDLFIAGPGSSRIYRDKKSVFDGCPNFRVIALKWIFVDDTSIYFSLEFPSVIAAVSIYLSLKQGMQEDLSCAFMLFVI
jgi:hypothetical protein